MNAAAQTYKPLVSVVIPCYNREGFVAAAIESVLKQTYQKFEVILVNDGSTDRTEDVIERYLDDARVRYFKHDVNRGIAAARNTGIKNSSGEYVAFLDSDDMWLPGKIEAQLSVFFGDCNGDVGVVWTEAYFTDIHGHTRTSEADIPLDLDLLSGEALLRCIFVRNFIIAGTAMVRAACFRKCGLLDEQLRGGSDDCDLWIRVAPHFQFRYVPKPLAVIRLHDGNHSSIEKHFNDQVLIAAKAIMTTPRLAALRGTKFAELHYYLGVHCLEHGSRGEARRHLWKAVRSNSTYVKPLIAWVLACCGPFGKIGLRTYRQVITLSRVA